MLLYDDGLLKLDQKVGDLIPEFLQNGKDNVTIRQLYLDRSGEKPDRHSTHQPRSSDTRQPEPYDFRDQIYDLLRESVID